VVLDRFCAGITCQSLSTKQEKSQATGGRNHESMCSPTPNRLHLLQGGARCGRSRGRRGGRPISTCSSQGRGHNGRNSASDVKTSILMVYRITRTTRRSCDSGHSGWHQRRRGVSRSLARYNGQASCCAVANNTTGPALPRPIQGARSVASANHVNRKIVHRRIGPRPHVHKHPRT
jgi:hypothetical protein